MKKLLILVLVASVATVIVPEIPLKKKTIQTEKGSLDVVKRLNGKTEVSAGMIGSTKLVDENSDGKLDNVKWYAIHRYGYGEFTQKPTADDQKKFDAALLVANF